MTNNETNKEKAIGATIRRRALEIKNARNPNNPQPLWIIFVSVISALFLIAASIGLLYARFVEGKGDDLDLVLCVFFFSIGSSVIVAETASIIRIKLQRLRTGF